MIVDRERVENALPGYTVGGRLGSGAYGLVLAGEHRRMGRAVAIKVLEAAGPEDVTSGFAAEARVLAGLDHPHVLRVHDYVEAEGLCLVVMELLAGGTLARRRAGMGPQQACAVGLAVAGALEHAHDHGVLHRDIKADNVLFTRDGTPKVSDFGIAKLFEGASATASRMAGTPLYMAPEQIQGGRLRPSTDLYALGVLLYWLLAGRPPFDPNQPLPVLWNQHLTERPPPMTGVAAPLAAVVLRAMEKAPGDRFADASAFALGLARASADTFGPGWTAQTGLPLHLDDAVRRAVGDPAGATQIPTGGVDAGRSLLLDLTGDRLDRDTTTTAGPAVLVLPVALPESEVRPESEPQPDGEPAPQPDGEPAPQPRPKDRARRRAARVAVVGTAVVAVLATALGIAGRELARDGHGTARGTGGPEVSAAAQSPLTAVHPDAAQSAITPGTAGPTGTPTTRPSTASPQPPSTIAASGPPATAAGASAPGSTAGGRTAAAPPAQASEPGPAGPSSDPNYVSGSAVSVAGCTGWVDFTGPLYGALSAGNASCVGQVTTVDQAHDAAPGNIRLSAAGYGQTTSKPNNYFAFGYYKYAVRICIWNANDAGRKLCSPTYVNEQGKISRE